MGETATDDVVAKPASGAAGRVLIGAAVVLVIIVGVLTYWLTGERRVDPDNPFWFVGLLVMVGAALTVIAMVFKWMGLAHATEAFALPPGSVRTLLAIGVMVLFAVLGIGHIGRSGVSPSVSEAPVEASVQAPADQLMAELERYRRAGLIAVVVSPGSIGATPVPATLKLYRIDQTRPADIIEVQKQMITTIVTLLTTVIGFYFGSRSAESALDKAVETKPAEPPTGIRKLQDDLQKIDTRLVTQAQRLEKLAATPADRDRAQALEASVSILKAHRTKLEAERDAIRLALGAPVIGAADVAAIERRIASLRDELDRFAERITGTESLAPQG